MFIIILGNLSEGFTFYGPYNSFDDADEASRDLPGINPSWIATLHTTDTHKKGE